VGIECWGTFDGVEDAEPARRSGADIDQSTSAIEPFGDDVDGPGDVIGFEGDRCGNLGILGIDELHDLDCGQAIQIFRRGIPRFGSKVL
jgi:hypothetical protein